MRATRGLLTVTLVLGIAVGISACGTVSRVIGGEDEQPSAQQGSLGINGYLWRASLDTLEFLPLETADPWGGIINYGWYSTPDSPNERLKATVYILDSRLRADALNVRVNRQVRNEAGEWVEAQVSAQTETDIENAILTRARQLRLTGDGD